MEGPPARHRRWIKYLTSSLLWAAFIVIAFGYALGGLIGVRLLELGKLDAAIAVYRVALRIYPWNELNHNDLGLALLEYGDVDGAIVELEQAVALAPGVSKYHNHLGVALLRKGRLADAIRQFQEAVRLDPQYEEPRRNLEKAIREQSVRGSTGSPDKR